MDSTGPGVEFALVDYEPVLVGDVGENGGCCDCCGFRKDDVVEKYRVLLKREESSVVATVLNELVGHFAHAVGAADSGVRDAKRLRELVGQWRAEATKDGYRAAEAKWARDYWLSDLAVGYGYGVEDLTKFFDWLEGR